MKKYIKPAIEEITLGVYAPIADSNGIPVVGDNDYVVAPDGSDGGSGMWAPSKKGSNEEEDTGFGW